MNFSLYLPIAGTSVNLWLLLGLGGGIGLLSGLFGVGGGFLLTPLLMMIGIPPTVAAASGANQIVGASMSGVYAHWRLGNVDFRMGAFLIAGGLIGGTAGVQLIKVLRATGDAESVIQLSYVVMLGTIGGYMLVESLKSLRGTTAVLTAAADERKSWLIRAGQALPWQVHFEQAGLTLSPLALAALGALVGSVAAMGVGGGFIMVPVMVYLLRMPVRVIVGTSLLQVLVTCINVTFMHAYTNHAVDFVLVFVMLVGSTVGAQVGARLNRQLKADHLKALLAAIVLAVMVKILLDLLMTPDFFLAPRGGHR